MYIIDGTSEHADQIGYSTDNINWSYIYKSKIRLITDHVSYVRLNMLGGDVLDIIVDNIINQPTWHTDATGGIVAGSTQILKKYGY